LKFIETINPPHKIPNAKSGVLIINPV